MATQPIGFERWEPGGPWGDVVYADGDKLSVHDPDGSIEADARQYGARYNAQPKAAPAPVPQPSLTGAAGPPLPPSTPSPAPPLPSGKPLDAQEKAAVQAATTPTPAELSALGGALAGGAAAPAAPGVSPTLQALKANGVDPAKLTPGGAAAPPAAPAPMGSTPGSMPGADLSPTLAAVREHAPGLVAAKGDVKYEGPDQGTRAAVQGASDASLEVRNTAIDEQMRAKGMGVQAEAGAANEAYFRGMQQQNEAMGQQAAEQKARAAAATKLNTARAMPIADHPDFPDWFVATSILGAIAGGFNQGFTGGAYKSTTLPMLNQLISDWRENQRYNKGQLLESLTAQLGDHDAALSAASAKLKESFAQMAEAKAKFARTPGAMQELKATADGLRAQSLDEWGKTQTTVMGKESMGLTLDKPPAGPGYTNSTIQRLGAIGIDPKAWDAGLGEVIGKDGPTIVQAAQATKQINADIAELKSIMAQNGNTLPTKGAINIPTALVGPLSRLGYTPGMRAEETSKIINKYLTQKAKGYGGTITNGDRESAALEFGSSGAGFMKGMEQLRDANNHGIAGALEKKFVGRGQQALDILLDRVSEGTTPGVPTPSTNPLEVQNVEETGPAEQQFPETDLERQNRQAVEQRKSDRIELLTQPDVAAEQKERERLPASVRFSPF